MSVDHKPHPKPVQYVQIALVLGVLTAIEVALYYTEDVVGVFTDPLLIILAVGKFVIVVGWFMHLRFEDSLINFLTFPCEQLNLVLNYLNFLLHL